MAFGFWKTKKKPAADRCGCAPKAAEAASGVKVLGSGCAKCGALEAAAKAALVSLGMDPTVEHVRDFAQIAAYGVMTTPALVIDGNVVSSGSVLREEEIIRLLQTPRG